MLKLSPHANNNLVFEWNQLEDMNLSKEHNYLYNDSYISLTLKDSSELILEFNEISRQSTAKIIENRNLKTRDVDKGIFLDDLTNLNHSKSISLSK
jgi:hypothetical protein